MKSMLNIFLVSILIVSGGSLLAEPSNDNATEDSVNGIPQSLINQSEGIVIFPGACRVAAGPFNGPGARGIAMIQIEDGSWSNPFFVILREGNLGFQIGSQTSDIVMLFKDRNDLIDIDKAEITLGDDVGVEAGPVNKGTSSDTDITFETGIYSYHHNEELFAGISLNGGILSYNEKLSESLEMFLMNLGL